MYTLMSFPQPLTGLSYCLLGINPFFSNSSGQARNLANCVKGVDLMTNSSLCGRAGKLFQSLGVHCLITASPKIASLASFIASTPIFVHSLNSAGYFVSTFWMDKRLSVLISDDGISINLLLTVGISSGPTTDCWIGSGELNSSWWLRS